MIIVYLIFCFVQGSLHTSHCASDWSYVPRLHECLRVPVNPLTWDESEAHCEGLNSSLAVILTEDEYEIIRGKVSIENSKFLTWIALRMDDADNETFRWINREKIAFEKWAPGHPNPESGHHCIALQSSDANDGFHSLPCDYQQFFLCQARARGCEPRILRGSTRILESPNYPETYPPDIDCFYFVEVGLGKRVRITLEDVNTEELEDVLTLYDGRSQDDYTIARMSGAPELFNFLSRRNTITVHFVSNGRHSGNGFRVKFEEWNLPDATLIDAINGGRLASVGYPNSYEFTQQRFNISCADDQSLDLLFSDINIHPRDRLLIYQQKPKRKLLKVITGKSTEIPFSMHVNSGAIQLRFDGYTGKEHPGWVLHYKCDQQEIEIP